jgi:hypothetical protein
MRKSGARTLLIGGQACVLYGAAEFSRDLDLLILTDPDSLEHVRAGLADLQAEPIAVPVSQPPLDAALLRKGHAFHFRCHRPDVEGLRIDLMSTLRGVDAFEELWARRTAFEIDGEVIDMVARRDLVIAKQTQRDRDWPVIGRLVEEAYFDAKSKDHSNADFLLRNFRTPELLIEAVAKFPDDAARIGVTRPAVRAALNGNTEEIIAALQQEQNEARQRDRQYWEPLKRELEQFRHELRREKK